MIILDTNVVSEPLRKRPNTRVVEWIDRQNIEALYLTAITVGELRYGVAMLPSGKRKTVLCERLEGEVVKLFKGRVLPYDLGASAVYAALMSQARADGLIIGMADGQIAAIAKSHSMKVATRDTRPYVAAGIEVINPWD